MPGQAGLRNESHDARMDGMENPYQDNASQRGYKDLSGKTRSLYAEDTGQKTTDQAADQADGEITEQAVARPADKHPGQPAGDDAADNPNE
jgi:hypothetical protein